MASSLALTLPANWAPASAAAASAEPSLTDAALSGLDERVRTVDGTLTVDSPPGGPTAITVELPTGG